jgi:multiple sugar transport system ATP-binding protein
MSTIRFENVTKRYPDGTEAVKGIDLEIEDGEFMILVGPSGCGKTTALRMIAGLEDITDGELKIGGQVVNDLPPKRRDIAMVFQSYALYPHMSVRKNMGFALKLARVKKAEIDRRVVEAAEILDLTAHLDRRPANLSGGQRQRVAMGRAIVRDPQAFLMDEPLSNLDAKLRVQMRAEIARTQRRLGTTTVFVTHDQTEAMTLGDRVAIMRDGEIRQLDTPRALYEEPADTFVAGFIGSPPMNLVPALIEDEQIVLPFGRAPLSDALRAHLAPAGARGPVIAGLRPEAFEDASIVAAHGDGNGRLAFTAPVDLVESMGHELFVHFQIEPIAQAAAIGAPVQRLVARVGNASRVTAGEPAELSVSLTGLRLFHAETGVSLVRSEAVAA